MKIGSVEYKLHYALMLAEMGFNILPLDPNTKAGHWRSWKESKTTNPETIRRWFANNPDMNYGVNPSLNQFIYDCDHHPEKGQDGFKDLALLELKDGLESVTDLDTFTVRSRSGGRHIYCTTPIPIGISSDNRFDSDSVDIRGCTGYVVGPGCEVDGKYYEVINEAPLKRTPTWTLDRLPKPGVNKDKSLDEREQVGSLFKPDLPTSINRAKDFLKVRPGAVEGKGGDTHTYFTAMSVLDFGISEAKCIELMAEFWNYKCEPPWDVSGDKGSLEEKTRNAAAYRTEEFGIKAGVFGEDDAADWTAGAEDMTTVLEQIQEVVKETKNAVLDRIRSFCFDLINVLASKVTREYLIHGWIVAHGYTALLAKRGAGKSMVMLDLALRIAAGMDWMGNKIAPGFKAIYLCGEDYEGAFENIKAWCKEYDNVDPQKIKDNFFIFTAVPALMNDEEVESWCEIIKERLNGSRGVLFYDTWQRGTTGVSQNNDEEMSLAIRNIERIAKAINGPAVVAFHPPKHDETVVMGSSRIENETTGIWIMNETPQGLKLEVGRIKGEGIGNYNLLTIKKIDLGANDAQGNPRSGIIPIKVGGVESEDPIRKDTLKRVYAEIIREIELRRKEDNPSSTKAYATTVVAKIISGYTPVGTAKDKPVVGMVDLARQGDERAQELIQGLIDAGDTNLSRWQAINDRILDLLGTDPRGYDFGDGHCLRVVQEGASRRCIIDKSGI